MGNVFWFWSTPIFFFLFLSDGSGLVYCLIWADAPACVNDRNGWERDVQPMTRTQLAKEREKFWDTRVEGRPEMWTALRLAIEASDEVTRASVLEDAQLTQLEAETKDCVYCWDAKVLSLKFCAQRCYSFIQHLILLATLLNHSHTSLAVHIHI